ncbi:kinase-like protein [Choiromyces venosus 120613-1]|uniref:dual-specificity kinase n=1 Tax=Choiromyces venosus 120613-1 TaxID=1336337 RepID=A0A3N4JA41_9PEZI|nr:kinase-like protein [Choiromyces venosus 120613-1]
MSTPSTASAVLPPLSHYRYDYTRDHHRVLHPPTHAHLLNRTHLASPIYHSPVPVTTASTPTNSSFSSSTISAMASRTQPSAKRNRNRTPNWEDFYKNGLPKEVIVIDDSPPPESGHSSANINKHSQPSSLSRAVAANGHQYPSTNNIVGGAHGPRHADKKRKVQTSQYEPSYTGQHQHSYSSTQTPHANFGSPTTVSATSSTVSVNGNSTAGTSLGSNVGAGPSYSGASFASANGQKRKRVTRASQAAAAAANSGLDPYSSYHPPPRPPIKAKDVYVQPIPDPGRHPTGRVDDDDGHYIINLETDLTPRYRITKQLGQGTFGKVVEAYDRIKKTKCAIKVIRSVQKYRDASRIELRVLATLSCNDKENRNKCIHLRDCFDYRNHICIVTDLLGMSVFDFLKGNSFAPFPNSQIQNFARQLLTSVAFLHDLNLIHTDLKPENILLVHNTFQTFNYNRAIPSSSTTAQRQGRTRRVLLDTDIRLIDFGSATFDDEYHSSVVSTRHYRAPEIILGLGWSFPCDLWSIGCILVEFYTGDALFQTHDNLEHLAMMQAVVGQKIDTRLIRAVAGTGRTAVSNAVSRYFKGTRLDYPNDETTRASKKYVHAMKTLPEIIQPTTNFNKQFFDLLKRIFVYDPNKRITAKEALKHPWFREVVQDEGTEATKLRLERQAERMAAVSLSRGDGY